ncbi:hypothetical protein HK407_03g05660 [Ordospora pajunii]|jgi:hypothetical protein|uniref:uncharacterized protein n=1 Tax=Ordospora pajunii TaxID=3039483 RepID=UPI002952711C|nr:uncharacterized protein HK407_03g05660 [Ordospora pajunii]KAH9411816.1 hypothetical protein HK407_03g05660 [Ordospora pajunii]
MLPLGSTYISNAFHLESLEEMNNNGSCISKEEVKGFIGARFVVDSCMLLNLSYRVRYKALVLFHTFSDELEFSGVCMASVLLASKLEEEMCTIKRIVYVFNYLYTQYESRPVPLTSRLSIRLKEGCIFAETEMLRRLGFDALFDDVYSCMIEFLQTSGFPSGFAQKCFIILNTLLQSREVNGMNLWELMTVIVESCVGMSKVVDDILSRYSMLDAKKFDLQTFKEVQLTRKIDNCMIQNFVKRQRHGQQ